jgi:hypothetical protein
MKMKIRIEKMINGVSKKELMDFFTDPKAFGDLHESVTKVEVLSDVANGLGVKWRETRVMFGKEATEVMWVSKNDLEEGVILIEAKSMGTEYVSTHEFVEKENGVLLKFEFHGTPVALMAKFMTPIALLFKGATRKALENDLEEIKKYFENK